jgi:Flp pilus assembly protein TadD
LEARTWLTKSIQLKSDDPKTLTELGMAEAALGDGAAASESWTKALELDPKQYDALYNLALLELKNGRTHEGWALLERFAASAPRDRYARELGEARRLLQSRARS